MVEVTEKSTIKIPSCVINKELIKEIGEILENEKSIQERLVYRIDTKTKDAKSLKLKDFIEMNWGTDINAIEIETTDREYPKLKIKIDVHHLYYNVFSLAGKDPTWINGLTNRIQEIFKKHQTSYFRIENSKSLRSIISFGVACIAFLLPTFILLQKYLPVNSLIIVELLAVSYGTMGVYALMGWLFPHFEYEGILQKRVRKWIWIALFGSGLVPSIILKLIGF